MSTSDSELHYGYDLICVHLTIFRESKAVIQLGVGGDKALLFLPNLQRHDLPNIPGINLPQRDHILSSRKAAYQLASQIP